jgi:hypothetical protein
MTSVTTAIENAIAIMTWAAVLNTASLIHRSVSDVATIDPQIPDRHASHHPLFDHARVVPNRESPLLL